MNSFNSRTREDATHPSYGIAKTKTVSIHAPVRMRQLGVIPFLFGTSFNSRTREDATTMSRSICSNVLVSIHAPVRMRPNTSSFSVLSVVSIHAPVRMRHNPGYFCFYPGGFNSRTREDATCLQTKYPPGKLFQFTHP